MQRSNRFGSSRAIGISYRQKLIYIGGSAVVFAALALLMLILYNYNEAGAYQRTVNSDESIDQLGMNNVILLAPANPVPPGTKLSQVTLKEVPWPRNEMPQGAVRKGDNISAMYTTIGLSANQPIAMNNLTSQPPIGGLVDLIPQGYRATTIEVDATSGVENWAFPGTHVDILLTYHSEEDKMKKTKIIVEDAVVLSYNGQKDQKPTNAAQVGLQPLAKATVTLGVPVYDAVKIQQGNAMGRLTLILRNAVDTKAVGPMEIGTNDFHNNNINRERNSDGRETRGFIRFSDPKGSDKQLEFDGKNWYDISEPDL